LLLLREEQRRNKGEGQKHKGEEEEMEQKKQTKMNGGKQTLWLPRGLIRTARREQAHALSNPGRHCWKKTTLWLQPTTNYCKVVRKIQGNVKV
jgi:hypothetical protein